MLYEEEPQKNSKRQNHESDFLVSLPSGLPYMDEVLKTVSCFRRLAGIAISLKSKVVLSEVQKR